MSLEKDNTIVKCEILTEEKYMNIDVLKKAEKQFLMEYPGGFNHPQMVAIGKKHKMKQQEDFAQTSLSKDAFNNPRELVSNVSKLVTRSSLISVFEKPKFRDLLKSLGSHGIENLTEALFELIHGKEQLGFEQLVYFLQEYKLGKWPLATIIQTYYRSSKDVFVKPTTTKLIIEKLELGLLYKPTPTWEFYKNYRKIIQDLKKKVDKSFTTNNPAFCGFLMIALAERYQLSSTSRRTVRSRL